MVEWSIAAFRACESVRSIVVACPPGHSQDLDENDLCVVDGGATRAQSVSNALEQVETELVAIHDAARPLLTAALIEDVIATLTADLGAAGAIAATPVTDTIKRVDHPLKDFEGNRPQDPSIAVRETLDRGSLWAAQTPQVFRVAVLRAALAGSPERATATDEAMLVEAVGGKVLIHLSAAENLKVTTPLDLKLAELVLAERAP
jgi:2-C-methyl-D-erythritol 4-phosphate cytidylyltransferase